jgi:ribosomal protein S28E/S33
MAEEEQAKSAIVKEILGWTGSRGGITQVKVEFIRPTSIDGRLLIVAHFHRSEL